MKLLNLKLFTISTFIKRTHSLPMFSMLVANHFFDIKCLWASLLWPIWSLLISTSYCLQLLWVLSHSSMRGLMKCSLLIYFFKCINLLKVILMDIIFFEFYSNVLFSENSSDIDLIIYDSFNFLYLSF